MNYVILVILHELSVLYLQLKLELDNVKMIKLMLIIENFNFT